MENKTRWEVLIRIKARWNLSRQAPSYDLKKKGIELVCPTSSGMDTEHGLLQKH